MLYAITNDGNQCKWNHSTHLRAISVVLCMYLCCHKQLTFYVITWCSYSLRRRESNQSLET